MTSTHFCDTTASVTDAMQSLTAAPFLFVDCEGLELGTVKGQLSIISIGTPNAENVYLIDAITLPQADLQPVLELLTDEDKTKYVWDGRMDFRELLDSCKVALKGVIDLTLADVESRAMRGEGESERKQRLATRMHPLSQINNLQTDGVHRLSSLSTACNPSEHDIDLSGVSILNRKPDFIDFMQRPLRSDLQTYAVSDIQMMARLHTEFSEKGYLQDRQKLLNQSQRFFNIHQGRIPLNDSYKMTALLPLEVLHEGGTSVSVCCHCSRNLCEESFVHKRINRVLRRTASCKICHIIEIRNKLEANRESQRQYSYYSDDSDRYGDFYGSNYDSDYGCYDDYGGYSS